VLRCLQAQDHADKRCVYSTNLVIILGMMQVSKKIPFDDPNVLMGVRAMYIISNLIILGIYLFMQQKINAKKGTRFIPSPAKDAY